MRMLHELTQWEGSSFITLTYNDESLPEPAWLDKTTLTLFVKRLRELVRPSTLKYYATGEYGETFGRPHYHLIVFGLAPDNDTRAAIRKTWTLGFSHVGTVTPDSVRYVADYVQKQLNGPAAQREKRTQPFAVMSTGIGKQWAIENQAKILENGLSIKGVPQQLPRYYKDILDLDTEELAEKARQRYNEWKRERYRSEPRPTHIHLQVEDWNKQSDRNIIAKQLLFKKGKL